MQALVGPNPPPVYMYILSIQVELAPVGNDTVKYAAHYGS